MDKEGRMDYKDMVERLKRDYSRHVARLEADLAGMPEEKRTHLMSLVADMVASRDNGRADYHHVKWLEHTGAIREVVGFPVLDGGNIEKAIHAVLKHGSYNEQACVLRNAMEAMVHHHLERYAEQ